MATLKDIALAANVSAPTVSRILAGKAKEGRISDELAERICSLAAKMNFRPSAGAKAMRLGQAKQIGVLVRNAPSERLRYLAAYELILGINDRLERDDYLLSLVRFTDIEESDVWEPRVFREKVIDGMIIIDAMPPKVESRIKTLFPKCIWLESSVWTPEDCLHRDEIYSGYLAASELIRRGFTRLMWFGLPKIKNPHFSMIDRLKGVRKAAVEVGIKLEKYEVSLRQFPDRWHLDPTIFDSSLGVIAYSSSYAQRLAHATADHNLIPGHHFGLIACDELASDATIWPDLSRVTFDRFAIGQQAADMLLTVLQNPDRHCPSYLFRGELSVGTTCMLG